MAVCKRDGVLTELVEWPFELVPALLDREASLCPPTEEFGARLSLSSARRRLVAALSKFDRRIAVGVLLIVSLALFIFIWGHHIGPCGWLKQWGGSFAVASIVAGVRISSGTWAPLWTFLLAVACTNIFFVLWFGLLTVCQVSSQYGRTPHRRLDETDSEPELEEEEEHLSAYG